MAMNCLLIAPPYTKLTQPDIEESMTDWEYPLGLCYISAALKRAGHTVTGYDYNRPRGTLEEALEGIDVVFTGGLCVHYPAVGGVIERVRKNSQAIIVIGGGLVSGEPDFVYHSLRPDYAIAGEGEIAVVELLQKLEEGKRPQGIIRADPIKEIDKLPWADYDLFDVDTYCNETYGCGNYYNWKNPNPRYLPFVGSRGCPFHCTFCFSPLGKRFKPRNVTDLCNEITTRVKQYNLNLVGIVDETLGLNKKRLFELCEGLKEIGVPWMTQLRVDVATEDVIKAMADANCYYISWGIESAVDRILVSMKKKTNLKQIERALQLCWLYDIGSQGNILLADPEDDDQSMMDSLLWNMRNNRYGINLARLMPFPNSEIYQKFLKDGLIPSKLKFYRQACMWQTPLSKFSKITERGAAAIKETMNVWHFTRPRQTEWKLTRLRRLDWLRTDVCRLETFCIWCGAPIVTETYLLYDEREWDRIVCPTCNKLFLCQWRPHGSKVQSH